MRRITSIALCLAVFSMGAIPYAQSVADRVPITYAVEHAHSTGSCKGELIIDKWRFAYTSTDRPEDSRAWKLTDLKLAESKTPNELILRTRESGKKTLGQDRNYKFRIPGAGIPKDVIDYMNDRID